MPALYYFLGRKCILLAGHYHISAFYTDHHLKKRGKSGGILETAIFESI
jgi:hypothetical protein